MKIIDPSRFEWQDKEGYSKKILLDLIEEKNVVVQEVKIKPGETAKAHHHKIQTEIFYFLNEYGHWLINGEKKTFNKGDILVIEPFDSHEVSNPTKEEYLYLAFKYDYDPEDLYWD